MQQTVHPRSSANGFGRRRGEREAGTRTENNAQSAKSYSSRLANTVSRSSGHETPLRDRLVYTTTCLIGHPVEVQVKNGSIYSGIFHATNAEKDFGIILKMAHMTKDGSLQGLKSAVEPVRKAPLKILIIPAKELVQVTAKDVPVTIEDLLNEVQSKKQQDLLLDSFISKSHHIELERELEPWVPDKDDPQCPELENIFEGPWNRGWDQFETNKALFGVKSSFNEELYTTKLERGPQMTELEKEAIRIAREIEGEDTHDLHLAEERGIQLNEHFDIDEETRFSSVYRGKVADDSGYEEEEDILFDSQNDETFGNTSASVMQSSTGIESGKSNDVYQASTSSCCMDQTKSPQSNIAVDLTRSESYDHARQLASESLLRSYSTTDSVSRNQMNLLSERLGTNNAHEPVEKQTVVEEAQLSKPDDQLPTSSMQKNGSDYLGISSSVSSVKGHKKMNSSNDSVESSGIDNVRKQTYTAHPHAQPSSSASSRLDRVISASASSGPGLSPCSSVGSLSSEKSTLNPYAKEFKLNPNAKSFVPSQTPVRPPSQVSDSSYYFPPNMSSVAQMPGVPVGIGTSFPPPPVMYPQVGPIPPTYFHPNGPQYGQQMVLGHPRQVVYMPGYQPEMPYKGRDY